MNRALFDRNATACETAKHPVCTCPCGGKFHGIKHSKAWRDMTYAALEEAEREEESAIVDMFPAVQ